MFASIVGLILSIGVPLIIILNADRIVALLRLEKNFGPDFTINLPSEHTLLKIGVIFIGGITIINYVPDVISNIFLLLKYGLPGARETRHPEAPTLASIISSGFSLLLGIVVTTNYDRISAWFLPKDPVN
ncbi:MAG TPA: hypothetical protein VFE50_07930 [Cyclobacteriaceae bacterium]|nr:hypothetical protein [Cyclobacteriaceae bacterium]